MSDARAVLDRFCAASHAADMDAMPGLFEWDVVTVEPAGGEMRGVDAFAGSLRIFNRAAPDAKLKVVRAIESGDTVVIEGTYTGTHRGPLASPQGEIPPSGRAFVLPYVDMFEVRDGRVATHHVYYHQMSFLGQLGLLPQPAAG